MFDTSNRFSVNGRGLQVYLTGSPARPGAVKLTAQDHLSPAELLELSSWLKAKAEAAIADAAAEE